MNIYTSSRYYNTKKVIISNYGTPKELADFEIDFASLNYCLNSVEKSLADRKIGEVFNLDPNVINLSKSQPNMVKILSEIESCGDRYNPKEQKIVSAVLKKVYFDKYIKTKEEQEQK